MKFSVLLAVALVALFLSSSHAFKFCIDSGTVAARSCSSGCSLDLAGSSFSGFFSYNATTDGAGSDLAVYFMTYKDYSNDIFNNSFNVCGLPVEGGAGGQKSVIGSACAVDLKFPAGSGLVFVACNLGQTQVFLSTSAYLFSADEIEPDGLPVWAIVLIVIGAVALVGALAGGIFFFIRRRNAYQSL